MTCNFMTKTKPIFTPTADRVLIQREAPRTQVGIIHLPHNAAQESSHALVIAVGPTVEDVAPGQRVMTASGGVRTIVEIDDQEYWLIRESDLIAVLG